jgi:hypothetical protein
LLLAGVALNGVATACYIGAGLGPGPWDGLMTGIARRGHSLRVVRTSIELSVLAAGWLLGGAVGIGTLLYAVSIGPLVHWLLPRFTIRPGPSRAQAAGPHPEGVGYAGPGLPPSTPAPAGRRAGRLTAAGSPSQWSRPTGRDDGGQVRAEEGRQR